MSVDASNVLALTGIHHAGCRFATWQQAPPAIEPSILDEGDRPC